MRTVVSIAVLAAASFAFALQDPPKTDDKKQDPPTSEPPKQDPPVDPAKQDPPVDPMSLKQDPAKIGGTVETWYKVTQERAISQNQMQLEAIGYAHERIYKSGPSKYGYFFETDFDYLPPGEGAVDVEHVNIQVTGELEEDFDPIKLKVNCSYGTRTTFIELRSSSEKRYIEFRTSDGVQAPIEIDLTESLMLFDGISIFRLRQKGLLTKTGDVKISALNGAGAEPVEVTVIAGKPEAREFLGKKDTLVTPLKLSSETFAGDYLVDRYGRVLERKGFLLMGATEVMELKGLKITVSPDSKDAKGENSGLSQRGRRDPFHKMGVMTPVKGTGRGTKGPLKPGDTGPVIPKEEQLPQEIAKVEELIKSLRRAMAENNDPEAKKLYNRFLQNYKLLREMEQVQANATWVTTLDSQKAEAEKIYGGADKLLAQADAIIDQIATYLEALALEKIDESIKTMEKFRDRLELFNESERQLVLEKKIRDAGLRRAQCIARRELRDKKIVLTGVVLASESVRDDLRLDLWIGGVNVKVDEPVRVHRSISYAVVNDEYYREGDVVKGEGVRVDKIYRQGIAISYKDEVLEVPLRKR